MELLSDTSSSTFSSDEELFEIVEKLPRLRTFRNRTNPFEMFDNQEFKMRFRMNKKTVMELLHTVGDCLEKPTSRNMPVSAMNQLLIALRFYATGAFQKEIGDLLNIHRSTVCRIVKQVTHQLVLLRPKYVFMPQDEHEKRKVASKFYETKKFPSIIGCIDCTHVRINSPGGAQGKLFRNAKGFYSISTQIICDGELNIRDIVTGWHGSAHNSAIFDASGIRTRLETNEFSNYHLIGSNCYSCRNYLLTPVQNPSTKAENDYNSAHAATRNVVDRTFDAWKLRFPSLCSGLRTNLDATVSLIVATAVLHNIAIQNGDDVPPADENLNLPEDYFRNVPTDNVDPLLDQATIRKTFINEFFAK